MTRGRGRRRARHAAAPWSRPRMLALLAGSVVVALLLVAGLAVATWSALQPARHDSPRTTWPGTGAPSTVMSGLSTASGDHVPAQSVQAAEDALAVRAMPTVDQAASQPGPVSTRDPGAPLVLPSPTSAGSAAVPTGFPPTAAGALAQMAAIDATALQSGSLQGARAVITAWALPGGPTASSWSGVAALTQFFNAAGLSGGGSAQLALTLTPLMGLIKGNVGPDFVIPCVDFEADATLNTTARVAIADCERMVWTPSLAGPSPDAASSSVAPMPGRWMIGSGSEPAVPPSVWPDTDTAIAVGYRDLSHA
jgi:hypothetical protein